MDLWDLTKLLYRRWFIAVPILFVCMAAIGLAVQDISPDYSATGHLQMIPAPGSTKPEDPKANRRPVNPWLELDYDALGNAAMLKVVDARWLSQLADRGLTDKVTVVLDGSTATYVIDAIGTSPQQATATVREVIRGLQQEIASKQSQYGALPEDTITTLVLNDGGSTKVIRSKVTRVLLVATGIALLVTVAATVGADTWLRRRKARQLEAANGPDQYIARIRTEAAPQAPHRGPTTANGANNATEVIDEYRIQRGDKVDDVRDEVEKRVEAVDETIILPIVGSSWSAGTNAKR